MRKLLIAVSATFGAAVLSLAPAGAAADRPGKTVLIVGEETFKPNEFMLATFRYKPGNIRVREGATVTWDNRTTDAHTVSVVTESDIPKTIEQVTNCAVCGKYIHAHAPNGPPPQGTIFPILHDFKPAQPPAKLESPGDSILIAPPGFGFPTSGSAQITAPAGTTLHYLCAFHAWMIGSIHVITSEGDDDQRGDG
jgi:plastocyanin